MTSREVLEDANILMDAEMMDAVVGGANCTDSCKKGCKSQCKHAVQHLLKHTSLAQLPFPNQ